jgi:RNA polymerase sigma-70 factor (ECF subfamily)
MTDQQIIQGIINRDESAFREFVDKYQEMVLNVCNSFLHNYDDSMDVSQEVFIKVFDSIPKFKEQSKISTWLYRIAVNKSLNYIRDKKRKNIFSSLDLLFDNSAENPGKTIYDETSNSAENMEKEEEKEALYKAIDSLPKKQKVALTLNKLEEVPYKDIAEIMNISVTETGVLINRAKKKIQQKLVKQFK